MEFFEVINKRHCTRSFTSKKVSEKDMAKLIETGKRAPSAGGIHPVKFAVVTDQKTKKAIADTTAQVLHRMDFIEQASAIIIVYADVQKTESRYKDRGRNLYVIQDAAVAAENIFLAATALGIGACWVGAFDEDEVRKVLHLKANQRPMTIMPLGYGDGKILD
jgi:nitroreductase